MPAKADASTSVERVMIYIDGSNLYHVLTQNCGRHDLVFEKFVEKLADGRNVKRTYYYNIRQESTYNPQASVEQQKFLSALYEVPYFEIRLGVHRRQGDQMVEKGVDVMMATDLVAGAFRDLYDTAVVVSGDGDFYPAMQVAKDLGKHIEVVAFESNLSPEAKRVADIATIVKKTFFTGLWTTRRRTPAQKADDDAGATTARSSTAKSATEKSDEDEKKPARRTETRRRRPARSASGSNGASPEVEEPKPEAETQEEPAPARAPARRREVISRRGRPGEPEASENGASDKPAEPVEREQSGSGTWWSRNRLARLGAPDQDKSE